MSSLLINGWLRKISRLLKIEPKANSINVHESMEERSRPPVDRRVEYCHFRIQQAITLCDEELDRLTNRLNEFKVEILKTKTQLDETDRQIAEVNEVKKGDSRRRRAGLQASISKVRAAYHTRIHQLQQSQAAEIEALQQNFEQALEHLTTSNEENLKAQEIEMDSRISKLQEQVKLYESEISKIQSENASAAEATTETFDSTIVDELEIMLRARTEERLVNLTQSRGKLAQCMETLDNMVHSHTIKVDELRKEIEGRDERHESDVQRMNVREEVKINRLKQELVLVEERQKKLANAARHVEKENQNQIALTIREIEQMKHGAVKLEISHEDDGAKLKKLEQEVRKLRRELNTEEENLRGHREENEMLKREIGRVKHEIGFRGRLARRRK
jgi:chromosome segregation ATPase